LKTVVVLLDELWAELERDPSPLQLSNEQRLELDRRLDTLDKEGPAGLAWEELFAFARKQTQ
jgi:putative addiction module component (TIGR02574 family)